MYIIGYINHNVCLSMCSEGTVDENEITCRSALPSFIIKQVHLLFLVSLSELIVEQGQVLIIT